MCATCAGGRGDEGAGASLGRQAPWGVRPKRLRLQLCARQACLVAKRPHNAGFSAIQIAAVNPGVADCALGRTVDGTAGRARGRLESDAQGDPSDSLGRRAGTWDLLNLPKHTYIHSNTVFIYTPKSA